MPIGPAQTTNGDFGRGNPVSPTAAVPFQRRVDPQSITAHLTLQAHEQRRLQRYTEHWNFYYSRHWTFTREDGEPLVTLNYFRKLLDKATSFLFGQGVTYTVPEALEQITLPFIEKVWEQNEEASLYFEIGTAGGVTGDAFILFTYEEPTATEKRLNPFAKGRIRINLLGSEQVFPSWDPLDIKKMTEVRIETVVVTPMSANTAADATAVPGHQRYTQIITPETITVTGIDGKTTVTENKLGEIPIVHIKNLSLPNEYYGMPDGQDLIDLNRELNEKATDISDVVNYHAGPVTVITGAKAKQLERGTRKIWSGLPADANVFNLSYEGDMNASQTYFDRIKKAMHELSDIPENSLGGQQAVSNTSGVALSMLYRPLIEKIDKKKATYGPGLSKGNYFILRIGEITGQIKLRYDLCESCGGRIVEHEVVVPGSDDGRGNPVVRLKKDCYKIDKQSLDFLDPMEVKLKFIQSYPEGSVEHEEEYWKILTQYRKVERSFWQPEKKPEPEPGPSPEEKRTAEEENAAADGVAYVPTGEATTEEEDEFEKRITRIGKSGGDSDFDVPLEPEEVTISPLEMAADGTFIRGKAYKRTLVPTGCKVNEYLNPFKTETHFGEPLPRDEKLDADLYQQYLGMGIVSKKWVQRQIPRLKNDLALIQREIEDEPPTTTPMEQKALAPENKSPEDTQQEQQNKPPRPVMPKPGFPPAKGNGSRNPVRK